MRYVVGDMRRSNPGLTYNPAIRTVCYPPGTGLLRTCNILRIAGLPVLRNDGALRRDVGRRTVDVGRGAGRGYWAWIASRGSQ
ncbi:MAG: hypothetical protein LBM98_11855 [Oscillospiraceae bacterium]|nr:hypothetical protein [Oscillospiraceae bacterium]